MTIVNKNGKEYDLREYRCEYCDNIDNSVPWTGYGECEEFNMTVELSDACGRHSSIEKEVNKDKEGDK